MRKYVGVDWASNGWFGVILRDDDTWETDHFPTIWSLWKYHSDAARICVDIPIGLPAERRRDCDIRARQKLGAQKRRVSYTPIREAVYEQNLDAAKRLNEDAGYSIQNQAWSLVPRIREVDEFLDTHPGARDRLVECHPELCFYSLNGRNPVVEPARTRAGIDRRTALLSDEHSTAATVYEESCARYLQPSYASFLRTEADILNALVAAVTAQRPASDLSRLPEGEDPPRDARGLPMQLVYPSDSNQTRLTTLGETRS